MKMVMVVWEDAQYIDPAGSSFSDPSEFKNMKVGRVAIVGWLISKNKNCTIITEQFDMDTGTVRRVILIPKQNNKRDERVGSEEKKVRV